jgi:hypothetical protein
MNFFEFKKTIDRALLQIDFQIPDDEKNDFYIYAYNVIYDLHLEYSYPEMKPPKYYKFLLKETMTKYPLYSVGCY